jgi:hypothetical protein
MYVTGYDVQLYVDLWTFCIVAGGNGITAALCGAAPGMKVLLSLADNWKYPGGVDQYVDWSATTPERGAAHPRPPDTEGDTDNTVRGAAPDVFTTSRVLGVAVPSSDARAAIALSI